MKHLPDQERYESRSLRPNVLIIIATGILSGPGKGLLQFLSYCPELDFSFTLCNFNTTWKAAQCDDFSGAAMRSGIPVQYIKQTLPLDPFMLPRTIRIKRQCRANIIQTHGYKPNVIGFFVKTLVGTPWLAFAHGYTDDNRKIRAYNLLDQSILKRADRVVAVSNATKSFLMTKGIHPDRISVIRNAIEQTQVTTRKHKQEMRDLLGIQNETLVVGTVGRLNPEKGQIVFLEAFKKVLGQLPRVKAVIIGDGQDRRRLEDHARVNGMLESVIFTGHVNNVADYYQIMDLLVIPSYSEGLPNVLLEAMSFGIPVIATSVGGIPEIINDNNGILVPPGSHHKLGVEMIALLKDSGRLNRLKIHARESILSSTGPRDRARRIVTLYHRLLNRHERDLNLENKLETKTNRRLIESQVDID